MNSAAKRLLFVTGLAAILIAAQIESLSGATFTATRANPNNSFAAASSFANFVESGSYTGNGVDNRVIGQLGFTPDMVIVKGSTNQTAVIRTSTMAGDATKPLAGATALQAAMIKALGANSFTLGTNARVNANNIAYQWTAFKADPGLLKLGTYTGNGTGQSITGVGFQPEYFATLSGGAHNAIQAYSTMTAAYRFDAHTGSTTAFTALGSDGFSVGSDSSANANGTVYHYLAFNETPGKVEVGSYLGNNTDNRNLTNVGLDPQFVAIRANDTATARAGSYRSSALTGDSSHLYSAATNVADRIQALLTGGFQLGRGAEVNANNVTYHYLAARD